MDMHNPKGVAKSDTVSIKKEGWITTPKGSITNMLTNYLIEKGDYHQDANYNNALDAYDSEHFIGEADSRHWDTHDPLSNLPGQREDIEDEDDKYRVQFTTGYESPRSRYNPVKGTRTVNGEVLFEGGSVGSGASSCIDNIQLRPWYHLPTPEEDEEGIYDTEPVCWDISFEHIKSVKYEDGKFAIIGSRGTHNNLTFGLLMEFGETTLYGEFDSSSQELAAEIIVMFLVNGDGQDALATFSRYVNTNQMVQTEANIHITLGDEEVGKVEDADLVLLVNAKMDAVSLDENSRNGFSVDWEKCLYEQYPILNSAQYKDKVKVMAIGKQIFDVTEFDVCSNGQMENILSTTFAKAYVRIRDEAGKVIKSYGTLNTIAKARNYLKSKHICKSQKSTIGENIMEAPAQVKKAMEIVRAWQIIQKAEENGVTDPMFTMDGANDEIEKPKDIATPDANGLVDDEAESEMAPSAVEETGVPLASEDMTVDSADAVSAVPAVQKSMRRIAKALMRKAEEANPGMSEEAKEKMEDAIYEDLKDEEATEEIAEAVDAEGDSELADKLYDHADLLEEVKESIFKSFFFRKEDVGAQDLPETEVGVGTEEAVKSEGDNDEGMATPAVEEAGTEKVDVSDDLADKDAPKVEDKPAEENPALETPKDDTAVPTQKSYGFGGMSITDMIAQKRGQRIEDEEASRPYNGYRTVVLGEGKDWIFPPMKH